MTTKMKNKMMAMLTMLAAATPALAGEFNFQLLINRLNHHGQSFALGISTATPQPVVTVQRIWIDPVYETVVERVWVPTVQTAYRDVPVTNFFGQIISYRREAYNIESGYWTEVQKQVLVRPGYWTTAPVAPACATAINLNINHKIKDHDGHGYDKFTQHNGPEKNRGPTVAWNR